MTNSCPKCGGTDLWIECTVSLPLNGATGEIGQLESFEQLPNAITDIWEGKGLTACRNEDCEHEGPLSDFETREKAKDEETYFGPCWAWQTIFETLARDVQSSAFDPELRREIEIAIDALERKPYI